MYDLEFLREIFKDVRQHVCIGVITQMGLAKDNSCLRVRINLLPDEREIVANMSFADVNDVTFPEVDDLVTVCFVDGNPDDAHVLSRYSSSDELIPSFARTGHSVKYSRTGKKLYLGSDTKIALAKPNHEPTEPLVLGQVLATFLQNVINAFLNAPNIGTCAVGAVVLDPGIRTNLLQYLNTYITTNATNILSQIAFTERGT